MFVQSIFTSIHQNIRVGQVQEHDEVLQEQRAEDLWKALEVFTVQHSRMPSMQSQVSITLGLSLGGRPFVTCSESKVLSMVNEDNFAYPGHSTLMGIQFIFCSLKKPFREDPEACRDMQEVW